MKKIVSIMLVCLFVFTGILATSFAVSADDIEFNNADFDKFITILVGSLQDVTDKDVRAARFNWYLDTIGSLDSEIDARIAELYSGSAIADRMLNDLLDGREGVGSMEKDQIRLILEVLRSLPEEERAAAVLEFYSNQDNGAYYEFADPTSENYDEELDNAYKGIYDYYINEEFQATVLADYGLEYIDFVPFLRVLMNHFQLTTDSNDRLAVLAVSDEFAENILANVTATSINGVEIVDKYTIIDQIFGKFNDGSTAENVANFKNAWDGEGAYELVGNFTGDDEGIVNTMDAAMMSQYLAEFQSVIDIIEANPVQYSAGAMVDPTNETLTGADVIKLLQYLARWQGIILGRATNNSYVAD